MKKMFKITVNTPNGKNIHFREDKGDIALVVADYLLEYDRDKRLIPNYNEKEITREIETVEGEAEIIREMKVSAARMEYEILSGAYVDDSDNEWWMAVVPASVTEEEEVMVHPEVSETRTVYERGDATFMDFKNELDAVVEAYKFIERRI